MTQRSVHVRTSTQFFTAPLIALAILLSGCDGPAEREAAYFERGEKLYDEERFVKAKLEFRNVLQINPKNFEAHYYVALIEEHEGNFKEAGQRFATAAALNPQHLPSQIRVGTYHHMAGDLEAAEQAAEIALTLAPNEPDALSLQAAIALKRDQMDRAKKFVDAAFVSAPYHEGATSVMVGTLVREGTPVQAIDLLADALEHNTESVSLRLLKIHLHAERNEADMIEPLYRELLVLHPNNRIYLTNLARLLISMDRADDAEALLLDAIDQAPEDVNRRLLLADFIATQRGATDAEDTLQGFIAEAPDEDAYRFGLATVYVRNGQAERAETVYREIVERAGTADSGLSARLALARHLLARNERPAAMDLVEEVLEVDPQNVDGLIFRAGLRLDDETALDDVITDLRAALRGAPASQPGLRLLADAYLRKGEMALATDVLQTIVSTDARNLQARLRLAQLLWRDGQPEAAFDLVLDVLVRNPEHADALRMKAGIALDLELWHQVAAAAHKLIATEDHKALGYQAIAMAYQAQGHHDDAIDAFKEALALAPNFDEAISGVAHSYAASDKLADAVGYFEKLVAADPLHAAAYNKLGEVHVDLEDLEQAEASFREAAKLRPEWTQPYLNLSRMLAANDDLSGAVSILKAAHERMPDDKRVAFALAAVLERSRDYDTAIQVYAMLLEAEPEQSIAANNMAALISDYQYEQPDRLAQALNAVDRFQTSRNSYFLDTLGWVHYRSGNITEAINYLERAAASGTPFPQLHYHLGMAYHANGQTDDAKEQLQKALANDAEYVGLEEARATLADM